MSFTVKYVDMVIAANNYADATKDNTTVLIILFNKMKLYS
jgi:hypothetical protein